MISGVTGADSGELGCEKRGTPELSYVRINVRGKHMSYTVVLWQECSKRGGGGGDGALKIRDRKFKHRTYWISVVPL